MKKVLIIGATSAIAAEAAKICAMEKASLFLVGRDAGRLDAIVNDLQVRGAERVAQLSVDLTDHDRHEEIITAAFDALGAPDFVLIAHGVLPDQENGLTVSELFERVGSREWDQLRGAFDASVRAAE